MLMVRALLSRQFFFRRMCAMVAKTTTERIVLETESRTGSGRLNTGRLRAEGKLPAIIYGLKGQSTSVSIDAASAERAVHSGAHLLDLKLNGQIEHVLIQDVQYDHLNKDILHVDFLRIDPHKKVHVRLPVEFKGVAKGAKEGGVLDVQHSELEVETLPLEIPDSLRVNIDDLELNAAIHARDVALPPGMKLLTPGEQIVCQVKLPKTVDTTAEATPGPTEPEVIGKKPDEAAADAAAAPAAAAGGKPAGGKK
jgi:large subunit ribosomal protein L25